MRGCGEKLAQAQTRSRRVQQRLNASSLFEPKGAFGAPRAGIVLAVATAAVYGIGSARSLDYDSSLNSRCVREDRLLARSAPSPDPAKHHRCSRYSSTSCGPRVPYRIRSAGPADRVRCLTVALVTAWCARRWDPSRRVCRCGRCFESDVRRSVTRRSRLQPALLLRGRVDPAPVAAGRVGAGARSSMGWYRLRRVVAAGISTHLYG